MNNCKIIAEIGINHNGDLTIAKKLVESAKKCGFDAVKFQKRDIETVYTKAELDKPRESPWGSTTREQKEGLEFGKKEYDEINNYCESLKIQWFASAWDTKSLEFLDNYNLEYQKVASAMITNIEFLESLSKRKKYTFISTGMSDFKVIDKAVEIFNKNDCKYELMHSVSAYPCPEDQLNLNLITVMRERYGCNVGYSGHESSVSPSIIAVSLGATSLERHITLDRSMYGSDQAASLEEKGFNELISIVRKIPIVIGSSKEKKILECEKPVAKKLRYWE
jgi:N-acetylneuraminate synthase|tara:strand:+ start:12449 stop:13285 length:837 start_codon:yes stop_codon:yes gene_type:complete